MAGNMVFITPPPPAGARFLILGFKDLLKVNRRPKLLRAILKILKSTGSRISFRRKQTAGQTPQTNSCKCPARCYGLHLLVAGHGDSFSSPCRQAINGELYPSNPSDAC